jgi:RNA polymerase sigma factor (sigma-70 family)
MAGQFAVMPTFDEFVATRLGALRSYAHLLAGDEAAAIGLVDEALVRTGLAWSRVIKDGDPEAYVRATVVALYLSRWRPRPRVGTTTADDQQAAATRGELAAHLRPALHRLPRRLRTVLVLRYVDGLPDAEVARLLGCSERKVRSDAAEAAARLAPAISR